MYNDFSESSEARHDVVRVYEYLISMCFSEGLLNGAKKHFYKIISLEEKHKHNDISDRNLREPRMKLLEILESQKNYSAARAILSQIEDE